MSLSIAEKFLLDIEKADAPASDWAIPPASEDMFTIERKCNFTPLERHAFLCILKNYAHIIENKRTDTATYIKKRQTWLRITQQFNAHPHTLQPAIPIQLRRLWSNLKQKQRRDELRELRERMSAGPLKQEDDGGDGGGETAAGDGDTRDLDMTPLVEVKVEKTGDSPEKRPPSANSTNSITFTQVPTPVVTSTVTRPQATAVATQAKTTGNSEAQLTQSDKMSVTNSTIETPHKNGIPPTPANFSLAITGPVRRRRRVRPALNNLSKENPLEPLIVQKESFNLVEKEYFDKQRRLDELHKLQLQIMAAQAREARAKADLAELTLRQRRSGGWN